MDWLAELKQCRLLKGMAEIESYPPHQQFPFGDYESRCFNSSLSLSCRDSAPRISSIALWRKSAGTLAPDYRPVILTETRRRWRHVLMDIRVSATGLAWRAWKSDYGRRSPIGIGSPIAEAPSHTARTYGSRIPAVSAGCSSSSLSAGERSRVFCVK